MYIDPTMAADALERITKAERVFCICHRGPDGDALGALVAMALCLEQEFPLKTVSLHCVDPAPDTFSFLPAVQRIAPLSPAHLSSGDLVVFLDCAEPKLTEVQQSHPEVFDGSIPTVMIDHHPDNPLFGTVNILLSEASSTCQILVMLFDAWKWQISPAVATALLLGVYTDTGGLLHSNTTVDVYRTVARLLRAGARRQQIVLAVFRRAKLSTLKLWGRVLEKISITQEGGAVSAVTEGDFRATGSDHSELTGAIDYVNAIPGMRFSMILSERGGKVKGSLRTLREDVDVAAMAGALQGGGHRKAAGFAMTGKLQPEVRWKVVADEEERGVRN